MTDLAELKAELQYCIENGMYGPRTGLVLAAALELVAKLEEREEA